MKIKEKEFEEIMQELKSVADQLGASVRFEKGDLKADIVSFMKRR